MWHEDNGMTARLERSVDIHKRSMSVFHVFQHVQAHNRVQLSNHRREIGRASKIAVHDSEVWPVLKPRLEPGEMLLIDISRYIGGPTRGKKPRQVADSCSDL
jgi:hypothetical protein